MDIHWYLYVILVLGNCGGLKGLADKAVVDKREFTVLKGYIDQKLVFLLKEYLCSADL